MCVMHDEHTVHTDAKVNVVSGSPENKFIFSAPDPIKTYLIWGKKRFSRCD